MEPLITDPDRLAVFLSGLQVQDETTADRRRSPLLDLKDNGVKAGHRLHRQAKVLDALARLLVYKNDWPTQVFAATIVPPSYTQEHARLIISENTEVSAAVENHARYILQNLYAARQVVDRQVQGGDSPPPLRVPCFIPIDSGDALHRKLADIETAIVRHSWSKMSKQLYKANRHSAFFEAAHAILSPGDEEVASLKARHGWPAEDGFVAEFRYLVRALGVLAEWLREPVDDNNIQNVRRTLAGTHDSVKTLRARMPDVFGLCSAYRAKHAPRIDFDHWIKKVLSTRLDFMELVRSIRSPALNEILTEQTQVTSTVPRPSAADALATLDSLKDSLPANHNVSDEDLDGYLDKKFKQKKGERVTIHGRIHCECAVLVELDKLWRAGETTIPYVGMPKLSCPVCSAYFEAYRTVTGHDVRTRGTHDRLSLWRCPTLDDEADGEKIRVRLSARLQSLLLREVGEFAARKGHSISSQNTGTSADEIMESDPLSVRIAREDS